ncbi:pilus assembly FimT family protein [Acinetobacter indicus]|uniref:pilus assembly FimT family protein n=1 Tax=Acinetobacter indicus TaxID=756892 RepID=UPI00144410F3|nr:prepilin-type N-terminal cleavage/methylation domain-containing protein [Acinetobacter indicus]
MRKIQGFTLIELMVTIAVLAIIAGMAAPSFTKQIRKNQLQNAAHEVMLAASETRSEAVLRKSDKTLSLVSSLTGGDKSWLPSEHVAWTTTPTALLKYNYFGYLLGGTNQCFVLEHAKDSTLKAVIRFNTNGSVVYKKDQTAC